MFINKAFDNRNNVSGLNIVRFRKELGISQRELADRLQLIGLNVDKNAVQRIESGQRFVTDIELVYISKVFHKSFNDLLDSFQPPSETLGG
ncbi:MAG: helix-turn-helix transcriptional regulator [Clostridia bacterium]|nr:helix-turn-helix transcriptional regulator [Clostridia bacterium]